MNKKRGVTLVEVVVAMAIAVIVSGIAFTTCNFALSISNKNKIKNFFVNEASNYINCYYLGSSKYAEAMQLLTGTSYVYNEDATIYYAKNLEISVDDSSPYVISLNFKEAGFEVKCYQSSNLVYEIEV